LGYVGEGRIGEVAAGYEGWLEKQPLSANTKRAYRTRANQFLGWLSSTPVEYGGEALSRYEVECDPAVGVSSVGRLREVKGHTLFETSIILSQLRLFNLGEALGEEGW
jgi:hypothetical protein